MMTWIKMGLVSALMVMTLSGCSYMEERQMDKARKELKSADFNKGMRESDKQMLSQLGMNVEVQNRYPEVILQMKFTTVSKDDLSAQDMQTLKEMAKVELSGEKICTVMAGALASEDASEKQKSLVARVFIEDNVVLKSVIKDKIGREMTSATQNIADCKYIQQMASR